MLTGGGIGPELTVDFEEVSSDPSPNSNEDLEHEITSIRRNDTALKGNIETRRPSPNIMSRNVAFRNEPDVLVNVLHCYSFPGIQSRHCDDIAVIRQNAKGEYAMMEHESVYGVMECLKVVIRENSDRLARVAFDYAKRHGRKKVTTIHKTNIGQLEATLYVQFGNNINLENDSAPQSIT